MENNQLKNLIVKISKSKDRLAFNQVFDYFVPRIIGYLVTSGLNRDVSEEIAQEVMTSIWQKAYLFDPIKANVSTWVFTITRNKKIDRFRKNKKNNFNTLDLIDNLYSNNNHENENLKEKTSEIQANLNKNERELIKMNFFEGKNHKIISQHLEIPLGTVKSRIRSTLKKMKEL